MWWREPGRHCRTRRTHRGRTKADVDPLNMTWRRIASRTEGRRQWLALRIATASPGADWCRTARRGIPGGDTDRDHEPIERQPGHASLGQTSTCPECGLLFGRGMARVPPPGVPPRPGYGGGSFGRQKYLMGSPQLSQFSAPFRSALGCGHQPRSRACRVRKNSFAATNRC
jgi:hypothetical protein